MKPFRRYIKRSLAVPRLPLGSVSHRGVGRLAGQVHYSGSPTALTILDNSHLDLTTGLSTGMTT